MVSQNGLFLGFILLVLCITYGSARKIISEDVMLNDSKRRLGDESMPAASELLPPNDVWVPEPVQEDSTEVLEVAHEPSGEPMSLGDSQVDCGRPQPRQQPSSPSCGCGGPHLFPLPNPNPCQPSYSPSPAPFYPPQQAPMYPPQQAPMYPPEAEPGCQPSFPPQQYYPPQPAPAYPPQVNPGCQHAPEHPTIPPESGPSYQPWPAPQPAPFYPPQTEPTYPPPLVDPNCILGCPPLNEETHNISELDHEKKDGGSMNEEEMSNPPPLGG